MTMQGIDIASYQAGLDFTQVPCDFAIIKSTQGTSYVNPDFKRAINQAINCGKKVGTYHYIGGQGAAAEMRHFIDNWLPYKGRAIPCLDWESIQNSAWCNESYLENCIKVFIEQTGIPPIIYASQSCFPWALCQKYNCGTWVAQYANMNDTGYQESPWKEGAYSCTIRQYSSCGVLPGWSGRLDINKAYIDAAAWDKYANPDGAAVPPTSPGSDGAGAPNGLTLNLAVEVMQGKHGNNEERKQKLGNRYDEVQNFINHIFSADVNTLADEVLAGKYGNGDTRKTVLGERYAEVQAAVNSKVGGGKSIDTLAMEVINGKWDIGETRRQKLTAAGYNYDAVQKRVNELLK